MDISILSVIVFVIVTLFYFNFPSIGKPHPTLDIFTNPSTKLTFSNSVFRSLFIYLFLVIFTQIIINSVYLNSKCGSSKNIPRAILYTTIPWILFFGIVVAFIKIYPQMKKIFSDVLGFFFISSATSALFGEILINTNINNLINEVDGDKQAQLRKTADAILKICGNNSVLINQINMNNFTEMWNILKPLMKENVYSNLTIKQQLLDLITTKENIGEFFWYLYTGILVITFINYELTTLGCIKDIEQIKQQYDTYQQEQASQNDNKNDITYIVN
jgi:hypothetical protein